MILAGTHWLAGGGLQTTSFNASSLQSSAAKKMAQQLQMEEEVEKEKEEKDVFRLKATEAWKEKP